MHEVLVNRLGGLSLPRKSVVRLTDRPDMTLDAKQQYTTLLISDIEWHILHFYGYFFFGVFTSTTYRYVQLNVCPFRMKLFILLMGYFLLLYSIIWPLYATIEHRLYFLQLYTFLHHFKLLYWFWHIIKVGKKAGNTHISQDGGKILVIPGK